MSTLLCGQIDNEDDIRRVLGIDPECPRGQVLQMHREPDPMKVYWCHPEDVDEAIRFLMSGGRSRLTHVMRGAGATS